MNTEPRRGFTLLELTMVIVIIAIIIAIGLPSLTRSRMAANEASAIGGLRVIVAAEEDYKTNFGTYGHYLELYYESLVPVDDPLSWTIRETPFIDARLGAGNMSGYFLWDFERDRDNYTVGTYPADWDGNNGYAGKLGRRGFWVDASGVIKYSDELQWVASNSPPLQ